MASVTASPPPTTADSMAQAGEPAPPARRTRFRRQLRSRIILAFVLLGFGLTALFAWATNWTRNRVENQIIEDVMNRNIDQAARQFEAGGDKIGRASCRERV